MEYEKENVNVVIVPENILQAIKNSSNLSIDIADALNISSAQHNDDAIDSSEASEVTNVTNGNVWLMLPSDSISINPDIALTQGLGSDYHFKFRPLGLIEDFATNASTINASTSSQAFQNFISKHDTTTSTNILPSFTNAALLPTSTCVLNSTGANNFKYNVTTENECETTAGVHVPQSSAENYFVINNTLKSSNKAAKPLPFVPKDISWNEKSPLVVSPVISKPAVVKETVSTADKSTHANGVKTLHKCDVENCPEVFKSASEFRKHKATVHGKEKMYKCKYANCLWSFSTPYKLRRHLESHYKRKPYACTYPGCNASFSNDYNQRAHMKLHTTINPNRICKHCGQIAANKRDLQSHLRKVHNQPFEHICSICKKEFGTRAALVIHKRSHNPPNEFECPVCKKKFVKRYYLKMHLYTHTGEKPFKCDHCNCGFASLSRLNRHMWLHKERRFECTEENCDKRFYRVHHLLKHLRTHGVEPYGKDGVLQLYLNKFSNDYSNAEYFVCEACGMKCLSSPGLKRHKRKCETHRLRLENRTDFVESDQDNEEDTQDVDDPMQTNDGKKNIIVEIDSYFDDVINDDDRSETSDAENELSVSENPKLVYSNRMTVSASTSTTCVEIANGMDQNWTPPSAKSQSLHEPDHSSQRLSRLSNQSASREIPLVPFIDNMNVLNDPTTQRFLQLNDDISSCVDSITEDGERAEQSIEEDVLQQYVISSTDLKKIIAREESEEPMSFKQNESNGNETSKSLFENDATLAAIEQSGSANYTGTTINIDDIH